MEVKQIISSGSCFFCLMKTKETWCKDCEYDFIREVSRCFLCARKIFHGRVCGKCLNHAPFYSSTEVLFNYEYPANELIKTFKFNKRPELAKVFAQLLINKLKEGNILFPDVIVPVPLHKKRQRSRGYNQSLEIAKVISKQLGINLNSSLCSRIKNTDPQSSLPMKRRHKNVKNAFSIIENQTPKHIVIIDDVITTGSTINELARLFRKAGCERIDVWAIGRT
jgi:ComF family protein